MKWFEEEREERRENNSSNNIRKFILKAHSIFILFFFFPFEFFSYFSFASFVQFQTSLSAVWNTQRRLGKKTLFSALIKYKIICGPLDCIGKINSTCFVRHNSQQWISVFLLLLFCCFSVRSLPRLCYFLFLLPFKIRIPNPHHVSGTLFAFQMERKNILEW